MARTESIPVIRLSHPEDLQFSLNNIINQLEKYGRAITSDAKASRIFSNMVKPYRNDGLIYFGNNRAERKSIIALSPTAKLEKIGNGRIKFKVRF